VNTPAGNNILARIQLQYRAGEGAELCVRRGDRADRVAGRRSGSRAAPPFPAQKGLWASQQHQQCRNLVQHRAIITRPHGLRRRQRQKLGHQVSRWSARCITATGRDADGTPIKTFIYDIGGGGVEGRAIRRADRRSLGAVFLPRCSTLRWTTRASRSWAPSWLGRYDDEDNCMVDVALTLWIHQLESAANAFLPRRAE